jgi:hypothetical protein
LTEREKLIAQSDIVKECVKHLIKKIKIEKENLKLEKEKRFGYDFGDYYGTDFIERKVRIETMIETMIEQKTSLEKFSKKLKHQAEETFN